MLSFRIVLLVAFVTTFVSGFSQKLNDKDSVNNINKNFYKLYSADFDHAKSLAKWAVETSHKNHWAEEEAWANLNSGVITYLSGDYENVLPKYFRSLQIFDSLNNKSGIAAINNEMAVFYHKQKDAVKSNAALDEAEKNARAVNDLERLGTTLAHRGAWLSMDGKYKDARPFFEEVLKIRKQLKDSVGLGYAYLDFAEMAVNGSDVQTALKYLDSSTVIRKRLGDVQGVAINLVNTGETYYGAKMYKEALGMFLQGLDAGKAIGYTDLVRHTNGFIADTYIHLDDYKNAYRFQELNHQLKDSLFNIERTKVIEDLEAKYETDKKNRIIERNNIVIGGLAITVCLLAIVFFMWRAKNLQKQKAVLQEQKVRLREAQINAVIESQEQERKRFATDLHDGMGQLIAALQLNIASLRSQSSFDKRDQLFESSEQLLNEVHDEIRNIAFNLMPPVLVKEGLVAATNELVRKINKTEQIKAALSAFNVNDRFPQVMEISLYRVIQELLSNIIKYSRAKEVTISFTGYDNEFVLTIDDDGDGYDLTAFQNSKEGNGWRNVNSRVSLIKGTIEIDTELGRKNSTVVITVPVSVPSVVYASNQNTERLV